MKIPVTLSLYICKQFLTCVGVILGLLIAIIMIFDVVDLLGRTSDKDVPLRIVIDMLLMKFPNEVQLVIPYTILLGSMMAYSRLTRNSELIVMRSAGFSAWQFLMPSALTAALMGVAMVTMLNPLSAIMLKRYERFEGKYLKGKTSEFTVSSSGLWLQEVVPGAEGKTVIYALRISQEKKALYDITLFRFNNQHDFIKRYDAKMATLIPNRWVLRNVLITSPGIPAQRYDTFEVPTTVKFAHIQDSFASPDTITFWELEGFIQTLKDAGFSALRHLVHWHSLLSRPFFLCALVYIGAAFSFNPPRKRGVAILFSTGILLGFLIHFLSDVVGALGGSGVILPIVAAWTPVAITGILGIFMILHLEDG
ncbi:MAG: LPS export ABC transporter permease LptG [Alphaproteobacteria bacterium]|nr:LPS export ABC transporter permease LptG [Alphaproteobacteria bacterium]